MISGHAPLVHGDAILVDHILMTLTLYSLRGIAYVYMESPLSQQQRREKATGSRSYNHHRPALTKLPVKESKCLFHEAVDHTSIVIKSGMDVKCLAYFLSSMFG